MMLAIFMSHESEQVPRLSYLRVRQDIRNLHILRDMISMPVCCHQGLKGRVKPSFGQLSWVSLMDWCAWRSVSVTAGASGNYPLDSAAVVRCSQKKDDRVPIAFVHRKKLSSELMSLFENAREWDEKVGIDTTGDRDYVLLIDGRIPFMLTS